jgi:hypothetical protein
MPLVGGVILAGVLIGIVVIMSKNQRGYYPSRAALPPAPPGPDDWPGPDQENPASVGPDIVTAPETLPPPPKTRPTPKATRDAVESIEHGRQTGKPPPPEIIAKGVEAARQNGLPQTADALAREQDRLMTEVIPALISEPDVPPDPIPIDGKSGKKLWIIDVRKGVKLAIPNFKPTMESFKALQKAIGVKADGRIGPSTLSAFQKKVSLLGFTHWPDDVEHLAANSLKWTEVLKKHFQPSEVGRPFDIPSRQWREFVVRASTEWDKLAPVIEDKLGSYIGQDIDGEEITMSGLFGLVNRAGLRGAKKWLDTESDRVRYPATTRAFWITNGIF